MTAPTLHRVEVRPQPGRSDPRAQSLAREAAAEGRPLSVRTAKVYLIEAPLSPPQLQRLIDRLLVDPVTEQGSPHTPTPTTGESTIEVHPLPGVMDPAAQSVRDAVRELLGVDARVSTGTRYDVAGVTPEQAHELVSRLRANPAIHQITREPWRPGSLPTGQEYALRVRHVALRDQADEQLARLSREAHLFLSLEEMRAVRAEFQRLGREPTDIELETIAQTWSEHCVHKTLKSTVRYRGEVAEDRVRWEGRPGHEVARDGSVTIRNLLKSSVAAATHELIADGVDWTLSVFKDNSGVIALDEAHGVCIKVETHNRPSAIEPYGGAATGAGGCIRDVMGTGLGARPIANTDVFCVARPDRWKLEDLPPGTLHPRRILADVVAGVRDYGNRMGIPTVNGAVCFDDRHVGNPLVFCGCVGIIPRELVHGRAREGDRVVALGGRTGRDGIHGATFSSAELEQTASTEFAHAVQIGNAIEEKRLLDAILRAREGAKDGTPLYHAITDCGAGGFSSAVGEMGAELGAAIDLERAPLKYAGLSYSEVWISEAQERMVLAVPPENLAALGEICREEGVELAELGEFGTAGRELVLRFRGVEVGRLSMDFLHEGIPTPVREAYWPAPGAPPQVDARDVGVGEALRALLEHPDIASKHWIVGQYDHEVQGNTVVKPLVGPLGQGPGDAAVLEAVAGSGRGVALACGVQAGVGDGAWRAHGADPYEMALAGIDECVRNLVSVGADPERIAILDNFCWPSCEKPENLASLVRACAGCYDGAKAYRTPFVSGKDSLNNQLRYRDPRTGQERVIEIPATLLISGIGIVADIGRCVTMDAKRAGNALVLVGATRGWLGASRYAGLFGAVAGFERVARVDLGVMPATSRRVASVLARGLARSCHDVSDGGVLVAVAEMLIASRDGKGRALGARLGHRAGIDPRAWAFSEEPGRYVLEVEAGRLGECLGALGGEAVEIGRLVEGGMLEWEQGRVSAEVEELRGRWRSPLDW